MKRFAIVLAGLLALSPAAWADTRVTTANTSEDSEIESGDASATNSGTAFVGQSGGGSTQVDSSDDQTSAGARGADITNNNATNVQEGDNELDADQDASAKSGDTVGGQVIGTVVDGTLTLDAANLSSDVDAESGDADADNSFGAFVGLSGASDTAIAADDDILNNNAENVLAGDNDSSLSQDASAVTGDAIGGQVVGGVTTGATDMVLANTSEDTETTSGDSDEDNDSALFTGLAASGSVALA